MGMWDSGAEYEWMKQIFTTLLSFLQIQCSFNFLSLSMPTSGGTQQRFAAIVSKAV